MRQPELSFIHGFMGHPSDWGELRVRVEQQYKFKTSAPELKPASNWDESVEQLVNTLPDLPVLVGYSMGARLALAIAINYPEKVAGIILISGNPGLESEKARYERWAADQVLAQHIDSWNKLGTNEQLETNGSFLKRQFLETWYQQPVFASLTDEVRRSEISRKMAYTSTSWSAILRCNSVAQQPDFWPRLRELSMPVRIVAGENDDKYSNIAVRICQQFHSLKSATRLVSNSGHIVHREQPEEMLQIILELVEDLR